MAHLTLIKSRKLADLLNSAGDVYVRILTSSETLSTIKPRSKRIVAANPKLFFEDAKLVEKYSEKLLNGWWYGTNNSADETKTRLKRACELAGLSWGKDFEVGL